MSTSFLLFFSDIFQDQGEGFFQGLTSIFGLRLICWERVMQMEKPKYIQWILAVEAVGLLAGFLTRAGMAFYEMNMEKPALTPPGIVFAIVWTILYARMGIGAARIAASPESPDRARALNVFVIQLALNFYWSLVFFNAQAYGFALLWLLLLWVFIILMILTFYRVDRGAALLQILYLLWVTFAAYLNYGVWQLNR